MKKLIVLFLVISVSLGVSAQDGFTGIGKLKIGVDTTIVEALAKENNAKYFEAKSFMDTYSIKPGTYTKIKSNSKEYLVDAPEISEVSVYKFGMIKIADIEIKNVVLKFYGNMLYSFKSDWSKALSEAMELKYPDFKKEVKRDTVSCVYKMTGNKVNEVSTMFYSHWRNGSITATTALGDYYNDKCQKNFMSYVMYSDEQAVKAVSVLILVDREQKKKKAIEESKSKLSEF